MGFLLKLVKQIFELPDDFIMVIVQKNTVNKTDHHITRQFCGIQIFVCRFSGLLQVGGNLSILKREFLICKKSQMTVQR